MAKNNIIKPISISETAKIQGGFTGSDKLKPPPPSSTTTSKPVDKTDTN